ncbi:hypothetical protein [Lysinibacillus sp.]|uniref:hypothetical protein n=1 Tax=Lysinibacillus sp. TaxID=1869345 RepID=UPI0028A0B736|nr:hypothetical protein [Lysinibacillus sp.]
MKGLLAIGEGIFFFYVLICLLVLNMIHFGNILFVDMPYEEPMTVTSSSSTAFLFLFGLGGVCFLYIRYFLGRSGYRRLKIVLWGSLFAFNTFGSGFSLLMSYGLMLNHRKAIYLKLATVMSLVLTIQAIMKYYEWK